MPILNRSYGSSSSSSGDHPMCSRSADAHAFRSASSVTSVAMHAILNSPSGSCLSCTVLITMQRGSRFRSCALYDCQIMPR